MFLLLRSDGLQQAADRCDEALLVKMVKHLEKNHKNKNSKQNTIRIQERTGKKENTGNHTGRRKRNKKRERGGERVSE